MSKSRFKLYGIAAAVMISTAGAPFALAADNADTMKSPQGSSASAYMSDSAITAKVKAALISNTISGVSVTTDQGVVALSGSVPNEEVRQQVTKIASSIDGVRGVDYSALAVKSKS